MEADLAAGWMLVLALACFSPLLLLLSQQSLLRQQERVEERAHEIEEQLCKLDSDKCVVEVGPGLPRRHRFPERRRRRPLP